MKCTSEFANPKTRGFFRYEGVCSRRANSKKIPYDLPKGFLERLFDKQNGKCAVSGLTMIIPRREIKTEKSLFQASVDRIDNEKGYTPDNVQFVCLGINYMRNSVSLEKCKEFMEAIKKTDNEPKKFSECTANATEPENGL